MHLSVELDVRAMDFDDLPGLEWSGSSAHLEALAEAIAHADAGELDLLIVTAGPGRSIACGAVKYSDDADTDDADTDYADVGELTMLSVHPDWQSLGVGTILIGALEQRIVARGRALARMSVEHDNPRAAALYRRLGYRPDGERVESWSVGGRRRYVTTCTTLVRPLGPVAP